MKYYSTLGLLVGATLLTGCVNYSEITDPPQRVNFTTQAAAGNVEKLHQVEIRTTRKEGGSDVEISGVACELIGNGYKAAFTTPVILEMPAYLGKTDPSTLSCSDGVNRKNMTIAPVNITAQQATASSGNLLADIIVNVAAAAIKAQRDVTKDRFVYQNRYALSMSDAAK